MQYWDKETINKIRHGFYSAEYFNRTKYILLQEENLKTVTMQIFQKQQAFVCGIQHVLELLRIGTGYFEKEQWIDMFSELHIEVLSDGDSVSPWQPVMHIKGPYVYFAHLESLYLGILARQTKIATNSKRAVLAAQGKKVIFFADRFDYFLNQPIDGYAAKIGGVAGVATEAQAFFIDEKAVGTMPHAFIAMCGGNTNLAAEKFVKHYSEVPLIVLVDFDNDCVETAVQVAKQFGKKLFAVRIDTSEAITDKSVTIPGVTPQLVKNVREALDDAGFAQVKIVVSGGFTAEKISLFEKERVPVDIYGVGSSLLIGNSDFTADIVEVEGKPIAKVGRNFIPIK